MGVAVGGSCLALALSLLQRDSIFLRAARTAQPFQFGVAATTNVKGDNAEQEERTRAPEPRQEGGDSHGESEIAVGDDNTSQHQRHEQWRRNFFFLRTHAGCASANPARGHGGLFYELHRGRGLLRQGDTFP